LATPIQNYESEATRKGNLSTTSPITPQLIATRNQREDPIGSNLHGTQPKSQQHTLIIFQQKSITIENPEFLTQRDPFGFTPEISTRIKLKQSSNSVM
jgi:hypothetical protein